MAAPCCYDCGLGVAAALPKSNSETILGATARPHRSLPGDVRHLCLHGLPQVKAVVA